MEINADFFKTKLKVLQEKLLGALQRVKHTCTEALKRLPNISEIEVWMRDKELAKYDAAFWKALLAKYGAQGKAMIVRSRDSFRESTFLQDLRVFFQETSTRLVVRREYTRNDLIALFILAVILGAGLKAVATDTITIGFDDYTLPPEETLYDLNALQQKFIDEGGTLAGNAVTPSAGSCSQ